MPTKNANETIYLQRIEPAEICFLQEVLYWLAFHRLPVWMPVGGVEIRESNIEGYKTDVPFTDGRLNDDECQEAELPLDPRHNYDWSYGVMLGDDLEGIAELAERDATDETRDEARKEATKLYKEISDWKPKYERVIALAASELYAALGRGRLTSKGKLLPDADLKVSLKMLAEQGKQLDDLEDVDIPKDAWSLPHIYWEISAARSDSKHYCQIYCPTKEVMDLFPFHGMIKGEPVTNVVRYGSFFVLGDGSTSQRASARRSPSRDPRRGAPPKYRWDELQLEMTALVREGLPVKRDASVQHLRDLCQKRGWPPPSVRSLYDFVAPYYDRFCGNSDS